MLGCQRKRVCAMMERCHQRLHSFLLLITHQHQYSEGFYQHLFRRDPLAHDVVENEQRVGVYLSRSPDKDCIRCEYCISISQGWGKESGCAVARKTIR